MQSAQNDFAAPSSIPARKLKGTFCERQVHGDAHHFGHGRDRRPAVEQIFIPILDAPVAGCSGGEAGERERGRQHMLPEAGVGIFGIKGVDEQRRARPDRRRRGGGIEEWWPHHFRGTPCGRGAQIHINYFIT